jgi:hypothetical protein
VLSIKPPIPSANFSGVITRSEISAPFPPILQPPESAIGTVFGRNEPCFLINTLLKGSIIPKPKRFSYKDANGHDTPIYLQLEQVAAIIVTPAKVSAKQ